MVLHALKTCIYCHIYQFILENKKDKNTETSLNVKTSHKNFALRKSTPVSKLLTELGRFSFN